MDTSEYKYNFGCASCGYKDTPKDQPLGRIDVSRAISKLDELFSRNALSDAGKLLDFWRGEAVRLNDRQGELSIVNEQLGFFRRTNEEDKAMEAVSRSLELIESLSMVDSVSSATILLNAATTLKAFGRAADALPLYERTLAVYQKDLDDGDVRLGGFYNNYALTLADLGMLSEAKEAYMRAISVMMSSENGKPEAAISYINMAYLYPEHSAEAHSALKRASDLLEECSYMNDGNYAFVLSKCAPAFRDFGYTDLAYRLEGRSKEIYERS